MKPSKRNILWIIPIIIIGIFYYVYGPQDDITDNEYIRYVQEQPLAQKTTAPIQHVLENSCQNPYWVYFESQGGQSVVEFKGECQVKAQKEKVNVQFLVNEDMTELSVGAILLNSKQLSKEKKEQFIATIASAK